MLAPDCLPGSHCDGGEVSMHVRRDVQAELSGGGSVVALESTVISHGLPYPQNLEIAKAMELAVRESGAVPATIGIISGEVIIGLDGMQLEHLAKAKDVRKCSRRDLALVTSAGQDGATTVSGTMVLAHRAGIRVFATGGIGGVHRGHPFDVSADLEELARTPIVVVCSGAKALLDLEATRERLDTLSVPVLSYGSDQLAAFYSRDSGLVADARVDAAEEIVAIARARDTLGLCSSVLVTVPVPMADELPAEDAEEAIERAVHEADERNIRGAAVTPFLLARIAELTDGRSLRANRSLLVNNARVAAHIALAFAS
jgi:pseudouridine-5'-phosphate glycosidase